MRKTRWSWSVPLLAAVLFATTSCENSPERTSQTSTTRDALDEAAIIDKSLMVVDTSVVDSPAAASRIDDASATGTGPFSFAHVIASIAGDQNPSVFTEQFMNQLAQRQIVNGFVSEPTLNLVQGGENEAQVALDNWCRLPNGNLDLTRAPFRLQAVVNRADLRQSTNELGELRFVFALLKTEACDGSGAIPQVLRGTGVGVIFEFAQPTGFCKQHRTTANAWLQLSQLPFGPTYNTALAQLTEQVLASRSAARPNGSQLNQVRIDTGASPSQWTLRELKLGGRTPNLTTAMNPLVLVSPAATPDFATFNNSPQLEHYVQAHEQDLISGTLMLQAVPDVFENQAFGGATSNILDRWQVGGVDNTPFNFMTCGGCHSHQAFGPHVGQSNSFALLGRALGERARLSNFMLDFDGRGELPRRATVLQTIASSTLCASVQAFGVVSSNAPDILSPQDSLRVLTLAQTSSRSGTVLKLYRTEDPDSATPLATAQLGTSNTLVMTTMQAPAEPGSYQLRLFAPEQRSSTRSRPVTVELNHVYSVQPPFSAAGGQPMTVFWQAPSDHSPSDTIGLYLPSAPDSAPASSVVTGPGVISGPAMFGTAVLAVPPGAGQYEVRYIRASGARVAVSSVVFVF